VGNLLKLEFRIAHRTDVGRVRSHNEDAVGVWVPETSEETSMDLGPIAVVADGLGGHAAGELASSLAVTEVIDAYRTTEGLAPGERLRRGVVRAHERILAQVEEHPALGGMGTTCTAVAIVGAHAYVAHVGDSRAYLDSGGLRQLTTDHTVVQELLANARVSAEQAAFHPAAHVLTRALGMKVPLAVDLVRPVRLRAGDRLVLCTDGLTGHCPPNEIEAITRTLDPPAACEALVERARQKGGSDNITIVVLSVLSPASV
jgi:protein phosphatase